MIRQPTRSTRTDTRSLHDALPISRRVDRRHFRLPRSRLRSFKPKTPLAHIYLRFIVDPDTRRLDDARRTKSRTHRAAAFGTKSSAFTPPRDRHQSSKSRWLGRP